MKPFLAAIVGIGIAMAVLTGISDSGQPMWGLMLAKCIPYAMLSLISAFLLAAKITFAHLGTILAGVGLVALDVALYVSVTYFPGSSTDSIALLTLPFFQAFGVLPLMFVLAFIVQWTRRFVRPS